MGLFYSSFINFLYFGIAFAVFHFMRLLLTILLFTCYLASIGQLDPRLGYDLFKQTNYLDAVKELKRHLKYHPKDGKLLYHIGLCYLNTDEDRTLAVQYLERAKNGDKAPKDTKFYLAIAYTHTYEFEKAIATMKDYIVDGGGKAVEAEALMESFKEAKKLYDNPVNVTFENMGEGINSEYPDYAAFVPEHEKFVVFTTRRASNKARKEFDGYYPSDIFISKFDGFKFSKAKGVSLNGTYDESCVGISHDGDVLFVYRDYISDAGDIYESPRTGTNFSKKRKIKEMVNDPESIETSACLSADGNTYFFASNRKGGKGLLDLYMTRKLPNGEWAEPQNINVLNSAGSEDYPSLSSDGKTLYFTSNGHGGMGGYDLFKCEWNPLNNTFSEPQNLGYPINTSYDDKTICFAGNDKHAYVSQNRDGSYGNLDIYRITFEEVELNPALFVVSVQEETLTNNVDGAVIFVYDSDDNQVGEFKANDANDIFMTLDPGIYSLEVEAPGYELEIKELKVSEFDYQQGMIKLKIPLSK